MKEFFIFLFLSISMAGFSQDNAAMQDAITKPAMSLRCKELLKERSEKIRIQQRLSSLLQRNQSMLKKIPQTRKSMTARLQANQLRIKNELYLTNLGIQTMEENIVRSGCPGLSL